MTNELSGEYREIQHETPSETLNRWEVNGIDGSLGLVGTSAWRLAPIIKSGILSIKQLDRHGFMPSTYIGKNFTFMAPLPGSVGHTADMDSHEALECARCYAEINSELDALRNILSMKGLSSEESAKFINEVLEPGVFTYYTLSKRALRRTARRVRKKLDFTNQEVYLFNRNVRQLTGVVLGIDPIVAQTHSIIPGLDDPRDEAIIDLGSRSDLPISFIQGIYYPPEISVFEREEIERVRLLTNCT